MDDVLVRKEIYFIAVLLKTQNDGKGRMLVSKNHPAHDHQSDFTHFSKAKSEAVVEETSKGTTVSKPIKEGAYNYHTSVRSDDLSGVVIVEPDYPQQVAYDLIEKVLNEFSAKVPKEEWSSVEEGEASFDLQEYFNEYQNPKEHYTATRMRNIMAKLEKDHDENEMIMNLHSKTDPVLQRDAYLNDLMEQSLALGDATRFERKSMKLRSKSQCCVIL